MPDNNNTLRGHRVAVLATNGFEQSELIEPLEALRSAGARADIVSDGVAGASIRGWDRKDWGEEVPVDVTLDEASPSDYDALVLPGGVMNPDRLRMDDRAVEFVKKFVEQGKPVAAICHAPWLLVEADVVRGRRLTSWPSLRRDLENAGAQWTDEPVVVDQGLVTSRKPADLPKFIDKMVEEIREGVHAR
jgi:protease I